ncbi:alpha/beta hydrolase [Halovulum dunhuangense]|uniref:Alpha/beta hydrolase n=1 Tax=Halovulum dunhuangense TaxID=1505036 RepID=A0A849L0Q3_9RHOB|nr:alpha/beta hydrolase [Halovulum dunhuangense]NNU79841.1 alpha/beta hydrolase [Halovulum dunhuangense]
MSGEERVHDVTGAGGVRLHVRERGPKDAPAILFIHGWSQHHRCWQRQFDSDLGDSFRLVALDLRGHGMSDKPEDGAAYADGAAWAGDIAALIDALRLDRPVLVGWSYGGRVIGEYLEAHGDAKLGGIVLAGAILATGSARPDWMVGPKSPGMNRDLYTADDPRRVAATMDFVAACSFRPLPAETYAEMVGLNMLVPAHVRRAMFAADRDLRPAYARITCPALIVHGAEDAVVAPATADEAARLMPHAGRLILPFTGHMPFFEQAQAFNDALRDLATSRRAAA